MADKAIHTTLRLGDHTINRVGFGAMQLTGTGVWGPPGDRAEAVSVLRRAVDLGVNFIDTAESYGPGDSEELIREALRPYPDNLVIATKGGMARPGPGEWSPLGRPAFLRQCVELSLRRLALDQLPLFQLHRVDPEVAMSDQLGELVKLRDEGKIRHIGLSEVTLPVLREALTMVDVVSVQNIYHCMLRHHDDVVDFCEDNGLAFIPFLPLGGGELPGEPRLRALADKWDIATPAQVALAWLWRRSPAIVLIPGTADTSHLEENLAVPGIELTDEMIAALDDLSH